MFSCKKTYHILLIIFEIQNTRKTWYD